MQSLGPSHGPLSRLSWEHDAAPVLGRAGRPPGLLCGGAGGASRRPQARPRRRPGGGPPPHAPIPPTRSLPPEASARDIHKALKGFKEPFISWPPGAPAAAAASKPSAAAPALAALDLTRAPLEIVTLGKLPGKISRQDLEKTGALVLEALAALDRPASLEALIADGVTAESKSSLGRVCVPLKPASESGKPIHPRRLLAILAHELAHPAVRESMNRCVPEAVALREHPPLVKRMRQLQRSIGNVGVDTQATIAELRALEIPLRFASVDAGKLHDPVELNRTLVDKFKTRIQP